MEWLDDSKACLDVARIMLDEVNELIQDSIQNDDLIPYLKVKIKNLLENCRSPLDYSANYIFDTYCRKLYTKKELRRFGKPYFPIRKEKHSFDVCVRDEFRKLSTRRKDIIEIFESCQAFNGSSWLQNLSFLINENKHRNLTKQKKSHEYDLKHLDINVGGTRIFFDDVRGSDVGTLIKYEDEEINLTDSSKKYINTVDGTVSVTYYFKDINANVLTTLSEIYNGSIRVINELEKVIERG
ncbi:hypothetical protein [Bacillus gobiensis]|uniref:hypothetical protein n=1 Tax=Bacillus gobiensis TaxID=1441095 RepID=UPI003D19C885